MNNILEQESFILRWNNKANDYNRDLLADVFDEFVTRFVVYNSLYNLCANEFNFSKKKQERSRATEAVRITLSGKIRQIVDRLIDSVKNIYHEIETRKFVIENSNEDKKWLNHLASEEPDLVFEGLVHIIYKVRCNLFHGNKEFMKNQRQLLISLSDCLRIINDEIVKALKERFYNNVQNQ